MAGTPPIPEVPDLETFRQLVNDRLRRLDRRGIAAGEGPEAGAPRGPGFKPTQPGSSDWSIAVTEYRNDSNGKQMARVQATVTGLAPDVEFYCLWIAKTDPLNAASYSQVAVVAKPATAPLLMDVWMDRPVADETWYAILTGSRQDFYVIPDNDLVAGRKSFSVIGIAAPLPPNDFEVQIQYFAPGVKLPNQEAGEFTYVVDLPADPQRDFVRIYRRWSQDGTFTTFISDWENVAGGSSNNQTAHIERIINGPWTRPKTTQYFEYKAVVYSLDGQTAESSVLQVIVTPGGDIVAPGATPPTQPGPDDWSAAISQYRNGQNGQQYGEFAITFTNVAPDVEYVEAWYSDTDSTDPADYEHLAVGPVSSTPFTITSWRERTATNTTFYVVVTASKSAYKKLPDAAAIANRKPVTMIGIAKPLAPVSFSISINEDNTGAQIAGQRAGRYAWQVVLPADPQRDYFVIMRRFATDGTFTIFSSAWMVVAEGMRNNQTAHTELIHSGWWPWPKQGEFHQWKAVVIGLDGSIVESATQNATLTPGGGLKLDQADPSTVGGGLAVIGGALVNLSRNGLQNGDFEYQLAGWNVSNPNVVADATTKFAGAYSVRVPGNGVNWNTVYQVLPTQPGQVWRMTCRVRNDTNAPVFPSIMFWRANGSLIESSVKTTSVPVQAGVWQTVTVVSGAAPSDAAYVRFVPLETNSTNTSGSAWADSVEVDLVTSVAASGGPLQNVTALAPDGEPTTNGIPTFYIFGSWTPETPTPQRTYVTASLIYPSSTPITLGRYSIQAGAFDTDRWPRPKTNRSATVRLTVTSQDGVLGASVDVPITIAAGPSGTLDLSTANPSTIGNGLWLDGSKIGSVTSDVSNAAPNGDFEQGVHGQPPPGWTVNEPSRVFIDNSLSHSGSNCVSMSGGTPEARLISAAIPCKAGESWYIEGVLRRDNASDGAFSAWVNVYDRLGTLLVTEETVGVLAGVANNAGWVTRTATFTTPLNAATMKIIVRASHSSGLCRVDSIILRRRVISELLADGSVQASKLAAAAVTTQAIANLAVDWSKIANLAVDAAKLADSAVTATKIANAAVGSAAIAAAAIGSAHIASLAVLDAHIANLSVSKLLAGSAIFTGDVSFVRSGAGSMTLNASGIGITNGSYSLNISASSIDLNTPGADISMHVLGLSLTGNLYHSGLYRLSSGQILLGEVILGFPNASINSSTGAVAARSYWVITGSAGIDYLSRQGLTANISYAKPGGGSGIIEVVQGIVLSVT